MAYKKQELIDICVEIIENNNLIWMTDIFKYLACSRSEFYELGIYKADIVVDTLQQNKIRARNAIEEKRVASGV